MPRPPVVLAAEGGDSIFIIPNATFIAELVAFLIVLFVIRRYVVPPLTKAMNERQEAIRSQIESAERAQAEAQRTLEEYRAQLADARAEASRFREEAREQGRAILEELRAKAQEEAARITATGESRLAAERQQVVAALRAEIGQLAVDLAEKIVGTSLAEESRQHAVIDKFLDELDARPPAGSDGGTAASGSAAVR